jgi:hypothetical protein
VKEEQSVKGIYPAFNDRIKITPESEKSILPANENFTTVISETILLFTAGKNGTQHLAIWIHGTGRTFEPLSAGGAAIGHAVQDFENPL